MSIPPIFTEMENPTPRRMLTVYVAGYGLAWLLYGTCALCGYATFGDAVTSNILDSYPSSGLVSTGRVGLAFVVIFSFPILAMAVRNAGVGIRDVVHPCCLHGPSECSASMHPVPQQRLRFLVLERGPVVFTSTLIIVAGIVGFTVTDIGIIADLSGALGAMVMSYIAPASIYFMLFKDHPLTPIRAAASLITGFGMLMLVIGMYTAVCGCTEHPWTRAHVR